MSEPNREGDWKVWREQWARFARWEDDRLRAGALDFSAAVEWLNDARELAARMDPDWDSRAAAEQHWRDLARTRDLLARIDLSR